MSLIVIQFITLDGIVSDPDGSGVPPAGGTSAGAVLAGYRRAAR